jgi:hypothetical protein
MAKEIITYSCGHTSTVNLFGKQADRDHKVAWLEQSGLCPDCYREQQQQLLLQQPPKCRANALTLVRLFRDRASELKINEAGHKMLDDVEVWLVSPDCDFFDASFLRLPEKPDGSLRADQSMLQKLYKAYKAMIETPKTPAITLVEPVEPGAYPIGRWNGKIYGSQRAGYSIYVDGEKEEITQKEKESIEQYQKDIADYKAALKDVAAGNTESELVKRFLPTPAPEIQKINKEAPVMEDRPLLVLQIPEKEAKPQTAKSLQNEPQPEAKPELQQPQKTEKPTKRSPAELSELRRKVMQRAWIVIKQEGKSKSDAMRQAWAETKK